MKNVIIIIVDSLRFDCLTCVKDKRFLQKYSVEQLIHTPNLDEFAKQGVFFEQARSTATFTPVAVASLFTGCYPPRHRVRAFYDGPIPPSVATVWELFSQAGYDTIFYRDNLLNPQNKDGFAEFVWDWNGCTRGCQRRLTVSTDSLFKKLENKTQNPFLLVAHFFDVHMPYLVASYLFDRTESRFFDYINSWRDRFGVGPNFAATDEPDFEKLSAAFRTFQARFFSKGLGSPVESLLPMYVEGVSKFDQGHFAYFMDGLRQLEVLDDALTVILADHGEAAFPIAGTGQKGFNHGCVPIDGAVRVPLIFYSPNYLPQGHRSSALVSLIDVLPTILDFSNINSVPSIQGKSLLPLLSAQELSGSPGYSEHSSYVFGKLPASEFRQQSIEQGFFVQHSSFVVERSQQEGHFRYVEKGDILTDSDWDADDVTFFCTLFRKVLAKWEDEKILLKFASQFGMNDTSQIYFQLLIRFNYWLPKVKSKFFGHTSTDDKASYGFVKIVRWFVDKQISREEVFNRFERSARANNKYQLYDTFKDPEQEVNLLVLNPSKYQSIAQKIRQQMLENTDEFEMESDHSTFAASNMEAIFERLEHLGYL